MRPQVSEEALHGPFAGLAVKNTSVHRVAAQYLATGHEQKSGNGRQMISLIGVGANPMRISRLKGNFANKTF